MNNTSFLAALAALLLVCAAAAHAHAGVPFSDKDLPTVRKVAGESGKLYFLHFTASWCMPCQWMDRHTFTDPALAHYVTQRYIALKADVDAPEGKAHQAQFGVSALPSTLVFNAQGVLVHRHEGSLDAAAFLEVLQQHDTPANRLGHHPPTAPAQPQQAQVLDSPKPQLQLSRPALIPDSAPGLMADASPQPNKGHAPAQPIVTAAYTHPARMAPRGRPAAYTVDMGTFVEYEVALRLVRRLEGICEVPVRLYTHTADGDQLAYRVTVGEFALRSKAGDYLYYLNRNYLQGEVMALPMEAHGEK